MNVILDSKTAHDFLVICEKIKIAHTPNFEKKEEDLKFTSMLSAFKKHHFKDTNKFKHDVLCIDISTQLEKMRKDLIQVIDTLSTTSAVAHIVTTLETLQDQLSLLSKRLLIRNQHNDKPIVASWSLRLPTLAVSNKLIGNHITFTCMFHSNVLKKTPGFTPFFATESQEASLFPAQDNLSISNRWC